MTHGMATMQRPCPSCGDTGIGLLGVREILVGHLEHPDTPGQNYPMYQEQEEWGTPCPACGKEAKEEKEKDDNLVG